VDDLESVLTEEASPPFDPTVRRSTHRVSTILATSTELLVAPQMAGAPPSRHLYLGRLARFYDAGVDQLPRVLTSEGLDPQAMVFKRCQHRDQRISKARLWVFSVPAAPMVIALSLDVHAAMLELIPLLEDCYYGDVRQGEDSLAQLALALLRRSGVAVNEPEQFHLEPECHQLVFLSESSTTTEPTDDVLQRLIYRADLDYRSEHSSIRYPSELNRRPDSLAAIGPFVSVLVTQQDYIENCAFLSAVHLVSATAKVRRIRAETYKSLVAVRRLAAEQRAVPEIDGQTRRRSSFARISERLAEQELELTFGVEGMRRIGLLVPSLRVESYHEQLVDALQLRENTATVSNMLGRLGTALSAELDSIRAYDTRREELRRLRWGVTVGMLTTIAVPVGIVLSFFSGQSSEVKPGASMFAFSLYRGFYGFLSSLIILALMVFLYLRRRETRELAKVAQVKLDEEDGASLARALRTRNHTDGVEASP
jgi:hypothetical protein